MGNDVITGVAVDAQGDVFIVGTYMTTVAVGVTPAPMGPGMFFAELDSTTGAVMWGKAYPGDNIQPRGIAVGTDGHLAIAGLFSGNFPLPAPSTKAMIATQGKNDFDGFVLGLDATGTFVWIKQIKEPRPAQRPGALRRGDRPQRRRRGHRRRDRQRRLRRRLDRQRGRNMPRASPSPSTRRPTAPSSGSSSWATAATSPSATRSPSTSTATSTSPATSSRRSPGAAAPPPPTSPGPRTRAPSSSAGSPSTATPAGPSRWGRPAAATATASDMPSPPTPTASSWAAPSTASSRPARARRS